jgi:flagellar hook assembly protein FlgD
MPYTIVVSIYNSAGEVVRNLYSGTSQTMPTALQLQSLAVDGQQGYQMTLDGQLAGGSDSLFWNEANDAGQQVVNGVYTFQVQLRDQYNHISTLVEQVAVASGQGTNTLEVFASNGELVWQMTLDRSNGDLVSFGLPNGPQFAVGLDASGSPLAKTGLKISLNNSKGPDGTVTWNGLGLNGQLLSSGIYTVQLLQSGAGGSVILESRQVVLLRTGTPQGGKIRLVPNPAGAGIGGGTKVTLYYTPGINGSALAEVYSIAGERVALGADSGKSGQIVLDMTKAASGTYIVSLTIRDNGMVLYRKVAKLAIVH